MTYQVVGECAYVTVDGRQGHQKVLMYRGAVLPEGAPEIGHLLDMKLIEKVGDDDSAGVNAVGGVGAAESVEGPGGGSVVSSAPVTGQSDDEKTEAKRAAARAKLPADGSAPHHNAGKDQWVEYAVGKGVDRAEAEKVSVAELRQTLASQQQ